MIEIIKELDIEVSKPNVFQAVVAKQYDMNTRFIKATFVDSGNKIYIDPDATVKVVINALRQDGQSKGFEGEVNQDGTVTVPLHSWMLELAGTVTCDISVIDTETDDNKKLTTTGFTLLVEQAAFGGDDITSDPQFDVLVALLEASEVAQEALDKSNEANSKYDACVEATEAAVQATNTLVLTHEEFVSGGYVEALKETNDGNKFSFWVGTTEEYNALPEKVNNCFYILTDEKPLIDRVYPVGSIYMSVNLVDPSLLFGGKWERLKDRFLLGAGDSYAAGAIGGEASHTLTEGEMPRHQHTQRPMAYGYSDWDEYTTGNGYYVIHNVQGGDYHGPNTTLNAIHVYGGRTDPIGESKAHNNMPPYLAVYMWKRIA